MMQFRALPLTGAYIVEPDLTLDERGYFARTWCAEEFARQGLDDRWVQTSASFNVKAGTLRGLHYQAAPDGEAKLIRCTSGAVFDVIVDLRADSPTCGRWTSVELTESNHLQLYIPRGFAHGYQTLADNTKLIYQISAPYRPESVRGVRWNDAALAVDWPAASSRIVSERDQALPDFQPCRDY